MKDITAATYGPRTTSSRRRRFGLGLCALVAGAASLGLSLTTLATTAGASNRPAASTTASTTKVTVTLKSVKKYGNVLFDQKDLALYYDTADKPPHFACTGGCLSFWPALLLPKGQKAAVAGNGVTNLGTIKSPEGMQVTWKGKPLYTYAADSKGTVNGQGIQGIWFVVHSTAALTATKTTATTASGTWG
jgi:predicted lipoprotein with Yx(FWY)xxD motif